MQAFCAHSSQTRRNNEIVSGYVRRPATFLLILRIYTACSPRTVAAISWPRQTCLRARYAALRRRRGPERSGRGGREAHANRTGFFPTVAADASNAAGMRSRVAHARMHGLSGVRMRVSVCGRRMNSERKRRRYVRLTGRARNACNMHRCTAFACTQCVSVHASFVTALSTLPHKHS